MPAIEVTPSTCDSGVVLITNHVLSGAVVGALVTDPGRALAAGFASHFGLDVLPHFGVDERQLMRVAVPDGLLGLAAIAVITVATPAPWRTAVLAGIVGACLPDLDKPGRQFFGRSPFPKPFDDFHGRIQWESSRLLPVEFGAALVFGSIFARLLRHWG